jgi:two-component system, NtrC family, nitrogen regulation sensor histidine kinase NtrY
MDSNKYFFGIIIRVILIVFSALLLAFLYFKTNYLYCITSLIIVISLLTWNLISYIIKKRDELKKMLEYIKENNATMSFSKSYNAPFKELGYFLNEIGEIIRKVRLEKENQFRYTQYIVEHIGIGLISYDEYGRVEFINHAAKSLLNIHYIASIEIIDRMHPGLKKILLRMNAENQKVFVTKSGDKLIHLAIKKSVVKIAEKEVSLVSFQDIKNELDENEIESWQKLTRVLTHEIINSITPVTSLTGTISGFFKTEGEIIASNDITDYTIREAVAGLDLIEERGNAVLDFVKNFKNFTKLPAPTYEEVKLSVLIENIYLLKKEEILEKGINLEYTINPSDTAILCDKNLMEHVIINLINNAADAVSKNTKSKGKEITIKALKNSNNKTLISVMDNGTGIPDNIIEDIFVPFFTTKDNGSGVGLSLSRQILKLHGGNINVKSEKGKTVFLVEI